MFKHFISEFKKFAMRGNVIDMAVGIVIGAAFGKIVDSLVKDIIMPPLGIILGKVDFGNLFFVLKDGTKNAGPYESLMEAQNAGAITFNIGNFLNTIISFIIIAFAIFILIKFINKLEKKTQEDKPAPAPTKSCPFCYESIPLPATRCPFCTSELKKKN